MLERRGRHAADYGPRQKGSPARVRRTHGLDGGAELIKVVVAVPDTGRADQVARVTYKDLCVDVNDLDAAAAFLGPLLGLAPEEHRDAVLRLGDGVPRARASGSTSSPNRRTVEEPGAPRRGRRLGRGGSPGRRHGGRRPAAVDGAEAGPGRRVLRLRTPPERLRPYRLYEVVVDCADPEPGGGLVGGTFRRDRSRATARPSGSRGRRRAALGARLRRRAGAQARQEPGALGRRGSTRPSRWTPGPTLLRAHDDEIGWDVLADVEGNEFCVFAPEG